MLSLSDAKETFFFGLSLSGSPPEMVYARGRGFGIPGLVMLVLRSSIDLRNSNGKTGMAGEGIVKEDGIQKMFL